VKPFADRVVAWQRQHGRHDLPWQRNRDPYRIWLSEIMLQQTQVATVVGYFERFVARFPDLAALAGASEDDVLALWSGLGYYSRARNLHTAACRIAERYGGHFPDTAEAIGALPGVGRATAAAVAALAFGRRCAILDGNVKRVLARHAGINGWPGDRRIEDALWRHAESLLPEQAIASYTQGMMDLGALLCTRTRPDCMACPVRRDCNAHATGRTHTLPTPRPKKNLPERHVRMLLLLDRGELLLEKRPAKGIWGGLWSLPEASEDTDCADHVRERYGLVAHSLRELPPLSHGFTHFRLHIRPTLLALAPCTKSLPGHVWLAPADALDAALPAPVRKLVAELARERPLFPRSPVL